MNMVKYKASDLPILTADQKDNLKRLAALADDNIDLSDIPEVTDWTGAVRGSILDSSNDMPMNLVKPSIVAKFQDKAKATGGDYQQMINDALEEYLIDH